MTRWIPWFILLGTVLAYASRGAQSWTLEQGVLYSSSSTLFIMSPQGGIDALDVNTGAVRWHSAQADVPLLLRDGRLLATGRHAVLLEASTGAPLRDLPPIAAGVGDGPGGKSRLVGLSLGGRDYLVSQVESHYAGGVARNDIPQTNTTAVFRVDMATGAITPCHDDVVAPWLIPSSLQTTGWRAPPGGPPGLLRLAPFDAGDGVTASVTLERSGYGTAALERSQGGRTLPSVRMLDITGHVAIYPSVSADRRHVAAVGQMNEKALRYEVLVYNASTGQLVGRQPLPKTPIGFVVSNRLLVYSADSQVLALDLDSGKLAWQRDVKPLGYRGPYPPGVLTAPRP